MKIIKRPLFKSFQLILNSVLGQQVLDSYINYKISRKYSGNRRDEWLFNNKNKHINENCVILATGPSLAQTDLSIIPQDWTVFGVNGIYLAQTRIDYYCYVSDWWHKNHIPQMNQVNCIRRFIQSELKYEIGEHEEVDTSWYSKVLGDHFINNFLARSVLTPTGFSTDCSNYIHAGGTVVSICLQLAYYLGFKRVVITGLDHSYGVPSVDKKSATSFKVDSEIDHSHFSPNYNQKGTIVPVDLQAMEKSYKLARIFYERNGRSIINASPVSYLDIFDRGEWNEDLFQAKL
ncbi:hypothetical protein OAZ88_00550 [bacterium]|nr:hypothetical protein [bacterium]